jgi:hypothetical protein
VDFASKRKPIVFARLALPYKMGRSTLKLFGRAAIYIAVMLCTFLPGFTQVGTVSYPCGEPTTIDLVGPIGSDKTLVDMKPSAWGDQLVFTL